LSLILPRVSRLVGQGAKRLFCYRAEVPMWKLETLLFQLQRKSAVRDIVRKSSLRILLLVSGR
jgi:hypothetical protein